MWHGILVVNKERGMSSHQVVAKLRRILGQSEIGHSGTLDPEATGVLVVGLGQATRSFQYMDEAVKIYRAELTLGQTTDTQDATGRIIDTQPDMRIHRDQLEQAIGRLTGEIHQVPTMFSAVKLHGQKLYDLARQGLEVEREARPIKVYHWQIVDPKSEYTYATQLTCEITCSKGTYIRTLIHDLGQTLGCGAHMSALIRLRSGPFSLEDAVSLSGVAEYFAAGRIEELLFSINTALSHFIPIWPQNEDLPKLVHGGKLSFDRYPASQNIGTLARALDNDSRVLAVLRLEDGGTHRYWQPVKVFHY